MEQKVEDEIVRFRKINKLDFRLTLPDHTGKQNLSFIQISKQSREAFNKEFCFPNDYEICLVGCHEYLHTSVQNISWKTDFPKGGNITMYHEKPVENKARNTPIYAINYLLEYHDTRLPNNFFIYLIKERNAQLAGIFYARYNTQVSNLPEIYFAANPYCTLLKRQQQSKITPPQPQR